MIATQLLLTIPLFGSGAMNAYIPSATLTVSNFVVTSDAAAGAAATSNIRSMRLA
jgi:hypothetical protein